MKLSLFTVAVLLIMSVLLSEQSVARAGQVEGIWLGKLDIPDVTVRLAFRINAKDDGGFSAVHDSPDYGITGIPVRSVEVSGDSVFVDIELYSSELRGKITGDAIRAGYRYGRFWHTITLERVADDPSALLDYMVPRLTAHGEKMTEYIYSPPVKNNNGWMTGDLRTAGYNVEKISELVTYILNERYENIHSLVVAKDDEIIVEEYFYGYDQNSLHPIHSITKGVVCTLTGIAIEKGYIESINVPVTDFFPEYGSLPKASDKEGLTLEHLLTMSAGLDWDEHSYSYFDSKNSYVKMTASGDGIKFLFELPVKHKPGDVYTYNSGLMIMLAEIVRRATQMPFPEFAETHLFEPLGITDVMWDYQPDGRIQGGGGLHLRVCDLAKIASLFTHDGRWKGQQLIDPSWYGRSKPGNDEARYWNHWGNQVFFIGDRPVEYYSGGGFGGQVIYGFPELNLVIAMNAGNFLSGGNQREMVERFILPAVMNADTDKTAISYGQDITALDNLEWRDCMFTNLGCIKGCMDCLGMDVSMPWLFGASGYAFAMNIHENVQSQGVGVWNTGRSHELMGNIGIEFQTVSGHKSWGDLPAVQKQSWDMVRHAIDEGLPCYGFHLDVPESYVIYGYDDRGYYFKGPKCNCGYGPKHWRELGDTEIGWHEVKVVTPCDIASVHKTVGDALMFAIDLADNPGNYTNDGFKGGLEGYDNWIAALDEIRADPFGLPYNAAAWSEGRRMAAAFLKEARDRLPGIDRKLFGDAIDLYSVVSVRLDDVSQLFPYHGALSWEMAANARDEKLCGAAIVLLEEARDAEREGIDCLRKIVAAM